MPGSSPDHSQAHPDDGKRPHWIDRALEWSDSLSGTQKRFSMIFTTALASCLGLAVLDEIVTQEEEPVRVAAQITTDDVREAKLVQVATTTQLEAVLVERDTPKPEKAVEVKVETFKKELNAARLSLQEDLMNPQLSDYERRILSYAHSIPDSLALTIPIKESGLNFESNNGDGYMQIKDIAVTEVRQRFKNIDYSDADKSDHATNIKLGLLYHAFIKVHYVDDLFPYVELGEDDTNETDKVALTHFLYNVGPSHGVDMWRESGASTYEEFLAYVETKLGQKLVVENPRGSRSFDDENFHVSYQQSNVDLAYHHYRFGKPGYERFEYKKAAFDGPFFSGGPDVWKVCLGLNYVDLSMAIQAKLDDPDQRDEYLTQHWN